MTQRKALGRGLSALLGDGGSPKPGVSESLGSQTTLEISLDLIDRNENQPRKNFDSAALQGLSESIRAHGILQPILLMRKADGRYEILAGERRFRAAQGAGLKSVPAVIRAWAPEKSFEIALIENIQRQDLSPLEEAQGYRTLLDQNGYTHEEIASRVGKSRSHITNLLRILKLPEETQSNIDLGIISLGQAKVMAGLNPAEQKKLTRKILKEKQSVRETEKFSKQRTADSLKEKESSVHLKEIERKLRDRLQTKVRLVPKTGKPDQGILEVEWYGQDDLNRLLQILKVIDEK